MLATRIVSRPYGSEVVCAAVRVSLKASPLLAWVAFQRLSPFGRCPLRVSEFQSLAFWERFSLNHPHSSFLIVNYQLSIVNYPLSFHSQHHATTHTTHRHNLPKGIGRTKLKHHRKHQTVGVVENGVNMLRCTGSGSATRSGAPTC